MGASAAAQTREFALPGPGPKNSLTDVAGLSVGCAHDAHVMTGVTVIVADQPAVAAVEVLGGGPGVRETDVLKPGNLVETVNAIALSGGSVYGLAAADGVATALGARGVGFGLVQAQGVPLSPIVPAAILYDLANGGDKSWGEDPPYRGLGMEAVRMLSDHVSLGNAGAGYGARAGALKGGQGSASYVTEDGVTVGALACVNAFGSTTIPNSRAFWAWPFEIGGEYGAVAPPQRAVALDDWGGTKAAPQPRANTTLAVIATDAAFTQSEMKRIAQMASAGFARAIRPVFAPFDGDVLFALSTAQREAPGPRPLSVARIGALAADCVARAVARGVYEAETLGTARAWRDA
ncbi:MAG: P1 family peptidase [Hyphomonadaceae bacterium]